MLRYEEKEKRRKRHKSASTKSHKDSDSSDTETAPSSRSQTPGRSGLVACAGFFVVGGGGPSALTSCAPFLIDYHIHTCVMSITALDPLWLPPLSRAGMSSPVPGSENLL